VHFPLRRLLPFLLAAMLLSSLVPGAAAAEMTVSHAEGYLASLINKQRAAIGLLPVRVDTRVRSVARARSSDMVRYQYFGHTNHDGRMAWDMMGDAGITWYGAGEIIAMNSWGTLEESAQAANRGWHDSPTHYAIISSDSLNYVGVGYAWDPTRHGHIWTAVFLRGPDRTGAWAQMQSSAQTAAATSTVTVSWRGGDIQLQVLTAGFRSFQLQRRSDGGSWRTLYSSTTVTSWRGSLNRGHRWEFRVRALDKAGNYGNWSLPKVIQL
jgi:uncharacterized protein YkwD